MEFMIKFLLVVSLLSKGIAHLMCHFDVNIHTLECSALDFTTGVIKKISNINTGYQDSQVSFYLWTRKNPVDPYKIQYNNLASLQNSKFDGAKKTYIINHGWTHNAQKEWVLEIKTNLLLVEDANVIALNEPLTTEYTLAACNVYKIARHNANFIKWLSDNSQLSPSKVHLIGHSLGAHISGLTGYYVKQFSSLGKISRITGLDPAGLLFSKMDPQKRLHKSQADFVDVIHTNACGLPFLPCIGLPDAVGHVDFYPNGGIHQTGCLDLDLKFELYTDLLYAIPNVCSHVRVCFLYAASILLKAPHDLTFRSWPCANYKDYIDAKCLECTPQCLDMGFYLNTSLEDQKFYLSTKADYPYAKGDMQ